MSKITLCKIPSHTSIEVQLPSSKSISNRAIIIASLGNFLSDISNLSTAKDTQSLLEQINSSNYIIDVGPAGTNFRFLTSYFAISNREVILTGSDRMKQRPIKELVSALVELGAIIQYAEKENFPPLKIKGNKLSKKIISIPANISSQFISSLMMIAPYIKNGLEINLHGNIFSEPYIRMTAELMNYFGIDVHFKNATILIPEGNYIANKLIIESDWSAAAFWFGIACCSNNQILLKNLSIDSIQGDKETIHYFHELGMRYSSIQKDILVSSLKNERTHFNFNLANTPDVFPALAITCLGLKKLAKFSGLETLNLKESNRIESIKEIFIKFGVTLKSTDASFEIIDYNHFIIPTKIEINSYDDHRIAMAASILCTLVDEVIIDNQFVINKSYPEYWNELKKLY